jgi:hypothetical protein
MSRALALALGLAFLAAVALLASLGQALAR